MQPINGKPSSIPPITEACRPCLACLGGDAADGGAMHPRGR
jgi:hypothetical protein